MDAIASNDAITMEIVRSALNNISAEMGTAVVRGGYSTSIKEGGDASNAIFDAAGRLVAQSDSTPLLHLCSLRPSLGEVIKDFPLDQMRDGDVYLTNDPFRGGIHSNDILLFKPVFHEGKPVFFTGTLIHVADVGGMSAGGLPANATEIYHEGLILPPMRFYEAGSPNRTLITLLTANSRTPDKLMGDLEALLGGVNVGAERLKALIGKYGLDRLNHIVDSLIDYAERRTRQEIANLRPGTYEGSFAIDDDGVEQRPGGFVVRVKVTIEDSNFTVDFTGTDQQARGAINAAVSQTMSGVLFALRCLIDPTIPLNDGCYAPVEMVLPSGTLVNPDMPAAVNSRIATIGAITDAILEAMSGVYPEKAIAASCSVHVSTPTGRDPKTGRPWIFISAINGGGGARSGKDGVDCAGGPLIIQGFGGAGTPTETLEMEYPILVERVEMWRDSGGAGKWRGGVGSLRDVRMLDDGMLTARIADRSIFPPRGIGGGSPGVGGKWVINRGTPDETTLPPKITNHAFKAGDVLTMAGSGGGGVGDPFERDESEVLADFQEHKLTIAAAREQYGVAIVAAPGDDAVATVDPEETLNLREAARS
ncbi:MAG: hydantoinase B/oxoprolinase family protein [Novosphingobium sp.]|nr:hydantoinase B/oxoprolinase family protein [Novosphingobium sp.]